MDTEVQMVTTKQPAKYWLEVLEDGEWHREVGWDDRREAKEFRDICERDGIECRIVEVN